MNSQRGFSIIEALFALSITSVLALGIVAAANYGYKSNRNFTQKTEANMYMDTLRVNLGRADNCRVNFKDQKLEKNASITINSPQFVDKDLYFTAADGTKDTTSKARILRVVKDPSLTNEVNAALALTGAQKNILVKSARLQYRETLKPDVVLADFVVEFSGTSPKDHNSGFAPRSFPLFLTVDSNNVIIACSESMFEGNYLKDTACEVSAGAAAVYTYDEGTQKCVTAKKRVYGTRDTAMCPAGWAPETQSVRTCDYNYYSTFDYPDEYCVEVTYGTTKSTECPQPAKITFEATKQSCDCAWAAFMDETSGARCDIYCVPQTK